MPSLHTFRRVRTVNPVAAINPATTSTVVLYDATQPARSFRSPRPFGQGLGLDTPTPADHSWHDGWQLGHDGIAAKCSHTDPELAAAWVAGYAVGELEAEAEFVAWMHAMDRDIAAQEMYGHLMGLADLVRQVHDAEIAECGSSVGLVCEQEAC